MSVYSRSLSRSRSRSRPLLVTESMITADTTPMIATTTSSSISVNPAPARAARCPPAFRWLLVEVPVADVGIDAVTARLVVGAQGAQIVGLPMRARKSEHVVITPGVLADALDVAAGLPVPDRRIGGLRGEGTQTLVVGRVLGVVHVVHGERRLEALDVLLRLGHPGVVDPLHDGRDDHRREQPDDDHHHHDLDQGEAPRPGVPAAALSANLAEDVVHTWCSRAA